MLPAESGVLKDYSPTRKYLVNHLIEVAGSYIILEQNSILSVVNILVKFT